MNHHHHTREAAPPPLLRNMPPLLQSLHHHETSDRRSSIIMTTSNNNNDDDDDDDDEQCAKLIDYITTILLPHHIIIRTSSSSITEARQYLTTIGRYIHYLMEHSSSPSPSPKNDTTTTSNHNHNHTDPHTATPNVDPPRRPPQQRTTRIRHLLGHVTHQIRSAIDSSTSSNTSNTSSSDSIDDANTTGTTNGHYCWMGRHWYTILLGYHDDCRLGGHAYLLTPLYQSMETLLLLTTTNNNNTVTPHPPTPQYIIPLELRQRTVICLLEHLQDGMGTMMMASVVTAIPDLVLKIVTFLVSRLRTAVSTLLVVVVVVPSSSLGDRRRQFGSVHQHNDNDHHDNDDIIRQVLRTLLQLRGIMTLSLLPPNDTTTIVVTPHTTTTTTMLSEKLVTLIDAVLSFPPTTTAVAKHNTTIQLWTRRTRWVTFTRYHPPPSTTVEDVYKNVVAPMAFYIGQRDCVIRSVLSLSSSLLGDSSLPPPPLHDSTTTPSPPPPPIDFVLEILEEFVWHIVPTTFSFLQEYYNGVAPLAAPTAMRSSKMEEEGSRLAVPMVATTLLQIHTWIIRELSSTTEELPHTTKRTTHQHDNDPDNHHQCRWTLPRFYQRLMRWLSLSYWTDHDDDDNNNNVTLVWLNQWMIPILSHFMDAVVVVPTTGNHRNNELPYRDEVHPLLAFAIKLLWDDRTETQLRRNLSRVLNQLLLSTSTTVSRVVGNAVLFQVPAYLDAPTPTQKRKNYWEESDHEDDDGSPITTAPVKVSSLPSKMTLTDRRIILSVLENIPMTCATVFKEVLPEYRSSFENSLPHANTLHTTVHDYDLHVLTVLTALLHLYQPRTSLHDKLLSDTHQLSMTIKEMAQASSKNNTTDPTALYGTLWISTMLRRVRRHLGSVTKVDLADTTLDRTCALLHSVLGRVDTNMAVSMDDSYVAVLGEAIQVLGGIGSVLERHMEEYTNEQQQQRVLQNIQECFDSVLSSPYWTIRMHAMTSLVQFASTIPAKYKFVLPKCVPSRMQKVLQCRLQNKIFLDGTAVNETDVTQRQQQLINKFCKTMRQQHQSRVSFGDNKNIVEIDEPHQNVIVDQPLSARCCTLPIGSYCMTMPTQEGRSALVIFPPDAMDDICTMIQQQQQQEDDDGETNNEKAGTVEWMEEHHIRRLNHDAVLSFDTHSTNVQTTL